MRTHNKTMTATFSKRFGLTFSVIALTGLFGCSEGALEAGTGDDLRQIDPAPGEQNNTTSNPSPGENNSPQPTPACVTNSQCEGTSVCANQVCVADPASARIAVRWSGNTNVDLS